MTEDNAVWTEGHPRQTKGPEYLYVVRVPGGPGKGDAALFGTFTSRALAQDWIESASDQPLDDEIVLLTDEVESAEILTVNNIWR